MRNGFLTGAVRHAKIIPGLILSVRGWPRLLMDCAGRQKVPYQLSCRGANCELHPGTSDWWIFLEIFLFGNYERAIDDIRGAKTIIDIGANVGLFAIYASSINPKVAIHSFEPFPQNVEHLKKNLSLNANSNVHVHPEAVSDKTGTAELYFSPGDESGCSLSDIKGQSIAVTTVQPKELFSLCKIQSCDLLKLDCEGAELKILEAAPADFLTKTNAVIMEYHNPAEIDKIRTILSRSGFKCELIESIHTLYASR